jgi:hypothetical protein
MTGQELGQKFFAYLAERKPEGAKPGEAHAYIFGSDEFVVNHDRCIIAFPEIGEVGFEKDEENDTFPEWIAAVTQADGSMEVLPGFCEPFSEQAKEILPAPSGTILAMPYWVKKRMSEPRVQKMLAKSRAGKKGWLKRS